MKLGRLSDSFAKLNESVPGPFFGRLEPFLRHEGSFLLRRLVNVCQAHRARD